MNPCFLLTVIAPAIILKCFFKKQKAIGQHHNLLNVSKSPAHDRSSHHINWSLLVAALSGSAIHNTVIVQHFAVQYLRMTFSLLAPSLHFSTTLHCKVLSWPRSTYKDSGGELYASLAPSCSLHLGNQIGLPLKNVNKISMLLEWTIEVRGYMPA